MFVFDKDMERVMLAKKKEVLQELEKAKKRILHELYCVKRSVHTDFCEMLADYNRAQQDFQKLADDLKMDVSTTVNDLREQFSVAINEHITLIDNKIAAWEQFETTVVGEINDTFVELEALQSQIDTLISTWEQVAADTVKQSDLDTLKQEMQEAVENAVSSIDFEQFKTEVEEMIVQSDWAETDTSSKSFVKNKPFYDNGVVVREQDLFYNLPLSETEIQSSNSLPVSPDNIDLSYLFAVVLKDTTGNVLCEGEFMERYKEDSTNFLCNLEEDGVRVRIKLSWTAVGDEIKSILLHPWVINTVYENARLFIKIAHNDVKAASPTMIGENAMKYCHLSTNGENCFWSNELYLASPLGSLYQLKVNENGELETALVTE